MRAALAVLAACLACTAAFSPTSLPLPLRCTGAAKTSPRRASLGLSMQATKTRGQALLEKYQASKGLVLPMLMPEEEAQCLVVKQEVETKTTVTAQMAASRVSAAPVKAKELTPEEQRQLDEKAGRVEKDRSQQEHVSDGGWWGKKSVYMSKEEGGLLKVAEVIPSDFKDPEKEARLAADQTTRSVVNAARAKLEQMARDNSGLAKSMIQLAWADASTFDHLDMKKFGPRTGIVMRLWMERKWPKVMGANGSIRFAKESSVSANAGVKEALDAVQKVRAEVPGISYADLFQLAGVVGVKSLGGPDVQPSMLYGRMDVDSDDDCAPAARHVNRDADKGGNSVPDLLFERLLLSEEDALALAAPGMLGYEFANPAMSGPGRSGPFVMWASQKQFQSKLNEWARDEKAYFQAYSMAHKILSERGAKFALENGVKAEVPAKKESVNLIKGWGGLGVHYDKETELEKGVVGGNEALEEVPWNRGKEVTAIFDENQLVAALGEEEYGSFTTANKDDMEDVVPAEVSV